MSRPADLSGGPPSEPTPEARLASASALSRRTVITTGALAGLVATLGASLLSAEPARAAAVVWNQPFTFRARLGDGFGMRWHPLSGEYRMHNGVDYQPGADTEIYSVAAGRVTFTGTATGYGQFVQIQHDDGYASRYAHMVTGSIAVIKDETYPAGTLVGRVGATGGVTGAHLHFEIQKNGAFVDPYPIISGTPLAGAATPAPTPTPAPPIDPEEDESMYIRRNATKEIAVFGAAFSNATGNPGRHIFASAAEYQAWRSVLQTYNSEIDRLGLQQSGKKFVPPYALTDVMGVDETGWSVACGVYNV